MHLDLKFKVNVNWKNDTKRFIMLSSRWSFLHTSQQTQFINLLFLFHNCSKFFFDWHDLKVINWPLSKIVLKGSSRLLEDPASNRSQKHNISNEYIFIRLTCSDLKRSSWCSDAFHDTDLDIEIRSSSFWKHVANSKFATLTTIRDFSSNTSTFWGLISSWIISVIWSAVVKIISKRMLSLQCISLIAIPISAQRSNLSFINKFLNFFSLVKS